MVTKITDIIKGGLAMLQYGKAPPNTPPEYIQELKEVNFLRSKKFFIVFSSVIVLFVYFGIGVFILFLTSASPGLTVPFITIFTKTIEVLAFIIAFYLGAQATIDFRYGSSSNTSIEGINKNTIETKTEVKKIIREGESGAPEIKPFGIIAVDE
jgi:hypothetical protein